MTPLARGLVLFIGAALGALAFVGIVYPVVKLRGAPRTEQLEIGIEAPAAALPEVPFGVFLAPGLERASVQPVTIAYRPRADLPATFYGWWGEMDFASHLGDVLARSTGGTVTLTFHDPLPLADHPDRKTLARAAEAAVRSAFPNP